MDKPESFEVQVLANLPKVEESPDFTGDRLWLTFYICGAGVKSISETLKAKGWVNVDGWEGGFIYPKVQSTVSAGAIIEVAREAQELCDQQSPQILEIDADTSPEVEHSRFIVLFSD